MLEKTRRYGATVLGLLLTITGAGGLVLANGASGQDGSAVTELQLNRYEIHRVSLDKPHALINVKGTHVVVEEAFLVLMQLEQPPFWGPRVDVFIGDYRVPEYGGWEGGLYFRIYDPALLQRLSGSAMRYRIADGPIQSFNRTFEVPGRAELPLRSEDELLMRRK